MDCTLENDCPECGGDVKVVPGGAYCIGPNEEGGCGWSERD